MGIPSSYEELDLTPPDNYADLQIWLKRNFALLQYMLDNGLFPNGLVLSEAAGVGIKTDIANPVYVWRDLIGEIRAGTGAARPSQVAYRGTIEQLRFGTGDEVFNEFHIPHDWVPGTDLFVHVHWSHIDAGVSGGTVTFDVEHSFSKGHDQAPFSAPKTLTMIGNASATQYQHIITETPMTVNGGSATLHDTADIEVDGVFLTRLEVAARNMTGANPEIYIHYIDLHYQSSNTGTIDKVPNFYEV